MKVVYCGIHAIHSKGFQICRPYGSNDYLFLHTKAPTRFILDGQAYDAVNNEIILYKRGTPQYFQGIEDVHVDDFLHFTTTCQEDEDFLDGLNLRYDQPMLIHYLQPLLGVHQNICHEYLSKSRHSKVANDALMRYFLIKLDECMNCEWANQYRNELVERLYQLRLDIYSAPDKKWNVRRMATSVNLSPSYFQVMYKRLFNTSCISDLISSRMNRAKQLLAGSAYQVSSIAEFCGYESCVYFSRHFKTKVGMSPSQYRAKYGS